MRDWIAARFLERSDALYDWSSHLLNGIEDAQHHGASPAALRRYTETLIDTVDACDALGIKSHTILPSNVIDWIERTRR